MKGSAIVTKFLGPTNTRGSRVKATLPSGRSIIIDWDHALNSSENHLRAAARAYNKWMSDHTSHTPLFANVLISRELPGNMGIVHIVEGVTADKAIND